VTTVENVVPRAAWIAPAIAWMGTLAALVVWLGWTPADRLREQLTVLQFWSLTAAVLLLLLAIHIVSSERAIRSRRDARPLAGIVALGVCVTLFVAPRTNRIFYDEQIYQNIGQNLAELRLAQACEDGFIEYGQLRCVDGEYNKQPYAYPYLLSVAYRVFGVHDGVAFGVNAAAMAAAICAVYFLTLLLFADRLAAAFAALVLALVPQQIIWSATAAAEPSASAAAAAGAAAAAYYLRRGSPAALAAMTVAAAFAIQFRPESFLILPVMGWIAWPRLWRELQRPRGWWAAVLFLLLAAVPVAHLFAVRQAGWGTTAARFSAAYVLPNLRINGRFFLADWRFPVLFTVLAAAGATGRRNAFERAAIAVYFLVFFAVDLAFYAGSYNYGADVRYSLMTYPPLAVLAGVGVVRVIQAVDRLMPRARASVLATALLLFVFLLYAPVVRATTEEAWAARADVRFAKTVARQLPPGSYVLSQDPGMFQVWGVSAGQMARVAASPAYARWLASQNAGGLYVHWNFWCNTQDPVQPGICRQAMALGKTTLVAETRERDQRFAVYKLTLQAP
jgi:hypothetical protein